MQHTDLPHTCESEDFDPDDCLPCLAAEGDVTSDCSCGNCCRNLIIEVLAEDALIEPKIAEQGDPIYEHPALTASGERELIGYLLNSRANSGACVFLDQQTNKCRIYDTRPLTCRQYDCTEMRDERIELGILPARGASPASDGPTTPLGRPA